MAIRKRGNSWQIDYTDPNGKRVRVCFKTRKEAVAEHGKRVSLIAEGRYLDVKKDYKTTMGELRKNYKKNFQQQASFYRTKCFYLENFINHFGEYTLLTNIKYLDLENYRNHLRQKPTRSGIRTDAAVNREMSCLRHIFSKAVEWEMMEDNPFNKGRSLFRKENNIRLRFLSEEEIQRLLAECSKHLARIVECAVNTGMRRGEILGLKWEQIRNGYIYLQKTKTNEPRQIPINEDLERLFKEIRREQQLRSEYVFTFWNGEHNLKGKKPVRNRRKAESVPVTIKNVRTSFKGALKRAGIENFRFHDLRHTFASHMIMRGASLKEVQEILGHKNIAMTMRYAHLSQEHKKKAVNRLSGLTASKKPSKKPADESCHKTVTFSKSSKPTTG